MVADARGCDHANATGAAVPRFVILEHDHPTLHWDFLLEDGEVLRAWRLLAEPGPGAAVAAEPNFDHRRLYLDYEGPVSGGRGIKPWNAHSIHMPV